MRELHSAIKGDGMNIRRALILIVVATTLAIGSIASASTPTPSATTAAPKPSATVIPKPIPIKDNNDLSRDEKEKLIRDEFGADGARMICIMDRESHGDASARNGKYGGAFQLSTGGTGSFRKDVGAAHGYLNRQGFGAWGNACGGGGSGGGRGGGYSSGPTLCLDHTWWADDVTWTAWATEAACDIYPEAPDWATTEQPTAAGCGWVGVETGAPKWRCTLRRWPTITETFLP